jgi:hypothetical protein
MNRPDLSPHGDSPRRLNVGWLENGHPFPQGKVPDKFAERLFRMCLKSRKTRGFHLCPFCPQSPKAKTYSHKGKDISFGSGEIAVRGKHWKTYVAPDLIYHYVVEHQYKPPDEFIEAVLHPRRYLTFEYLVMATFVCCFASVISFNAGYKILGTLFIMPIIIFFITIMGLGLKNIFRAKQREKLAKHS